MQVSKSLTARQSGKLVVNERYEDDPFFDEDGDDKKQISIEIDSES